MTEQTTKIPAKVKSEIEAAIKLRAKAKGLEIEAKELSTQAKDILLPLMTAFSIKDYTLPGYGKITSKVSKGGKIDEQILREELLLAGMDPETINKVIGLSTKTWETEYVDFRAEK